MINNFCAFVMKKVLIKTDTYPFLFPESHQALRTYEHSTDTTGHLQFWWPQVESHCSLSYGHPTEDWTQAQDLSLLLKTDAKKKKGKKALNDCAFSSSLDARRHSSPSISQMFFL